MHSSPRTALISVPATSLFWRAENSTSWRRICDNATTRRRILQMNWSDHQRHHGAGVQELDRKMETSCEGQWKLCLNPSIITLHLLATFRAVAILINRRQTTLTITDWTGSPHVQVSLFEAVRVTKKRRIGLTIRNDRGGPKSPDRLAFATNENSFKPVTVIHCHTPPGLNDPGYVLNPFGEHALQFFKSDVVPDGRNYLNDFI
jgi:hypothetical protein